MKQVYRLFKNSYRIFFNDRVSVMLTFIVPLFLMYLFGMIFGGASSGPSRTPIAVLNQSTSDVAKQVVATLDTMKAFRVIKSLGKNLEAFHWDAGAHAGSLEFQAVYLSASETFKLFFS